MVAEIFEYLFNVAKVQLQAQLLMPSSSSVIWFNGPMNCLMQTWKQQGVQGLYQVHLLFLLFAGRIEDFFFFF